MSTEDSTVPYGYCHCGCGEKTKLAPQSSTRKGWIKGEPMRYLNGHGWTGRRYQNRKDKVKAYRNKPEVKERQRAYYRENKERIKAQAKAWEAANPERKRAAANRRRAATGSHTAAELRQMYEDQQGLCAYCATPLFGRYHVDHMRPLSRDGTNDWTNLAIACPECNQRKGVRTAEEFMVYMTTA